MSICAPSEFKPLIDWSSGRSQGIIRHVIDVEVVESNPQKFDFRFQGTLSFFGANFAVLPPLWLDDLLGGTAVDTSNRKSAVIITIGLSKPVIRVWLRFMAGGSEKKFVTLSGLECKGGITISGAGEGGSNYTIILSKGTEIHIPTSVGTALR